MARVVQDMRLILWYNKCNEFEPTQTANAQTGDSNLHCCLNQVQGLRMADMRDNESNKYPGLSRHAKGGFFSFVV